MEYLEQIKDEKLRKAVLLMLKDWGYKLRFIPGSMTGRHHAKDELEMDGLKRHIEKMCWFLTKVCEAQKLPDSERDIYLTSAYFHDISKVIDTKVYEKVIYLGKKVLRRVEVSREVTQDSHPFESTRIAIEYLDKAGVDIVTRGIITNIIVCHMSHWYHPRYPLPKTEREKTFALADYIVSRPEFSIQLESKWSRFKRWFKK